MLKFKANYNTIIFGQTGDGKTQFMLNVIRRKNITPFPENIFYMYNVEQDFIKTWNQSEESKIKFMSECTYCLKEKYHSYRRWINNLY